MPVWLGILALQWVLTAPTLLGLDRDHSVDLLHGDQRPGLPGMAWLPPTLAATQPPACAFRQRLRRITRRRPRGVLGVLLEAFEQSLDRSLQFGNARFEGADILADGKGRLLPQLRWDRGCGVHGPASYATWIPVSKPHGLRPRERLRLQNRDFLDCFVSSLGDLSEYAQDATDEDLDAAHDRRGYTPHTTS